jgi:hypothetical protein
MEHKAIRPAKAAVHKNGYLNLDDGAFTMDITVFRAVLFHVVRQVTHVQAGSADILNAQ